MVITDACELFDEHRKVRLLPLYVVSCCWWGGGRSGAMSFLRDRIHFGEHHVVVFCHAGFQSKTSSPNAPKTLKNDQTDSHESRQLVINFIKYINYPATSLASYI